MGTVNYRSRGRQNQLPDWVLQFLLEGKADHSSIPGRHSVLPFTWQKQFNGYLSDPANWIPLWKSLKDEILPEWQLGNPGKKCWAELEIDKINGK